MMSSMKRFLGCLALGLATMAASAQWSDPAYDVPAYHAAPPTTPMPPILKGDQLTGEFFTHPYQVAAYKMAAEVPKVLYQEPCYCHCDRALHHTSLESCFSGTHGAVCSVCMREGIFTYQQTKKGLTPKQIRAAIERGEWQTVDLEATTF